MRGVRVKIYGKQEDPKHLPFNATAFTDAELKQEREELLNDIIDNHFTSILYAALVAESCSMGEAADLMDEEISKLKKKLKLAPKP